MLVWPGRRYPLGATYDGVGTNFAVYSAVAEAVELCLFDAAGDEQRIDLTEVDAYVWHVFLTGVQPGQRYGFRVYGPWDPAKGLRCNPHKLLLDPYAKAIDGDVRLAPGALRARPARPGHHVDHRLGALPAEGGRGEPLLRLGQRPHAAHALPRHGDLRGARQGADRPAARGSGGAARHVRGAGPPGVDRAPEPARGDRRRVDAGAAVRARPAPHRPGPAQLLGLQHDRLSSRPTTATPRWAGTASRCRSSAGWCGRCTPPASR